YFAPGENLNQLFFTARGVFGGKYRHFDVGAFDSGAQGGNGLGFVVFYADDDARGDRKSTRLNSSHVKIPYAVFCSEKQAGRRASPLCCGGAPRVRRLRPSLPTRRSSDLVLRAR